MKVLLAKPNNISDHIQPALGLGYLASAVRGRHDITILDCIKENIKPADFSAYLHGRSYNVIGFQCYTFDLMNLKPMVTAAKKSGAVTVIGGPHPSVMPLETMEFFGSELDYCFQGEAEIGFGLLLDKLSGQRDIKESDIPGLVWRSPERTVANDPEYVEDLDAIGRPAWDLIHPELYPEAQHGAFFKKFPIAPVILTRGCPFPCTFCSGNLISGKKIRKRSVPGAIEEIEYLYREFGIREFHVIDDNFTCDKEFAKDFLRALKSKKLDISWAVPNGVRMENLDEELLSLMKGTGLYLISLGIESGSDRVLKSMKKGTTTDFIRKTVNRIRKAGIDIAGFFIIGFPGETVDDIRSTIKFSLELGLIRANFFTYLPFPGTESYRQIEREEGLEKVNWKKFFFMSASYSPAGMDAKTLKNLQREAFFRFYLRPGVLWKNIREIRSVRHFKFLVKRFYHWIVM